MSDEHDLEWFRRKGAEQERRFKSWWTQVTGRRTPETLSDAIELAVALEQDAWQIDALNAVWEEACELLAEVDALDALGWKDRERVRAFDRAAEAVLAKGRRLDHGRIDQVLAHFPLIDYVDPRAADDAVALLLEAYEVNAHLLACSTCWPTERFLFGEQGLSRYTEQYGPRRQSQHRCALCLPLKMTLNALLAVSRQYESAARASEDGRKGPAARKAKNPVRLAADALAPDTYGRFGELREEGRDAFEFLAGRLEELVDRQVRGKFVLGEGFTAAKLGDACWDERLGRPKGNFLLLRENGAPRKVSARSLVNLLAEKKK